MSRILAKTQAGCRRSFPSCLRYRITAAALVVAVVLTSQLLDTKPLRAESAKRPNIVMIMADDLGFADLDLINEPH